MIAPATYNITIPQNATFSQQFQLKDGAGAAINMTGYTVQAQLWAANKASKLSDFTVTWLNQAQGSFKLTLSSAITQDIGSDGVWDLLVTNPDGTKDYWLRGAAVFDMGYTE